MPPGGDGELTAAQQRRNVAVFVVTNGLVYLSAPVIYVGITQASLCSALGSSDTVANLSASAAFWGAAAPLVVAWRFHTVASIRPVLVCGYAVLALAGVLVAAALQWPVSTNLRLTTVVLYGGLVGAALAVVNAFLWEMVGRGISQRRRGLAYALAFGVGPLLAVVGSLGAQWLLSGTIELPWVSHSGFSMRTFAMTPLEFPRNFAALFAVSSLVLIVCAIAAMRYVLPTVHDESPRPPFVSNFFLVGRELISDRVLLLAVVAYLLVDAGSTISNNMALYTPLALGHPAEDYAGYQNAIRFSFKVVAGLLLGWAIAHTHAKMGLLATCGLCVSGVFWLLLLPKAWFLVSFGLMGAGELYGVYYPNYIMDRSRPDRIRQNMALLQLLTLVTCLAPPAFGAISDKVSLTASFAVASCMLLASLLIVAVGLPAKPRLNDGQPQLLTETTEVRR